MPLRTAGEDDAEDRAELQGVQRTRLRRVADGRIVDPYAAAGRFAQAALRVQAGLDSGSQKRNIASGRRAGKHFRPDNGYRDKYITFDRCKQRVFVEFCIEIGARFLLSTSITSLGAKRGLRYPDYAP
jgi:hypothetical protein